MSEQRKMTKDDYWGMHVLECSCGGIMSINGQLLSVAISEQKYFHCPNRFYNKCNKSYSAGHFKSLSEYIKPQSNFA